MDDPNSSAYQGHADPNAPVIGTALTTRVRPGGRKPGRKAKRRDLLPAEIDKHEKTKRDIQRAHAKEDFSRRTAELKQQGLEFAEIAVQMSAERGVQISHHQVRSAYYTRSNNVVVTDRARNIEIMKLEDAAAKVWKRLVEMDDGGPVTLDVEVYAKVAETYLKYRERIAKLLGLDAAVKQIVQRDGAPAPGQPLTIDLDSTGLHIRMPGSIEAHQEWERLSELGLTQLAADVIELEEGDHCEVGVDDAMFRQDGKAGVTLSPHADAESKADKAAAAIAALEALQSSS